MSGYLLAIIAGLAGGLVASVAMNLYQRVTAALFGQDKGDDAPATVQAADSAKQATIGGKVAAPQRETAGNAVHYTTGIVLGVIYALLVYHDPIVATGFGAVFGIVVAVLLDDLVVPAFGWGPWPWATDLATHAYGLSAHVIFGLVLEGVRRLAAGLLS